MNDARFWDKNLITEFLETFKKRPCLWNIKCRDYTNKEMKKAAYEDLVQLCKRANIEADKFVVKNKIQALRASFRKELRKVELSIKNGGEIYRPRLWYFDLLMFTSDLDNNDKSMEAAENSGTSEGFGDTNFENDHCEDGVVSETSSERGVKRKQNTEESEETKTVYVKEEVDIDEDLTVSDTLFLNDENGKSYYTNTDSVGELMKNDTNMNVSNTVSKRKTKYTKSSSKDEEYNAVGVNVAAKLKRMDERQAIYAEYLINHVLCKGLLEDLSENSVLVT